LIIKPSLHQQKNASAKITFQQDTKRVALSLFKAYKRNNKEVREKTQSFMTYIAKNLDGRAFTMFLKLLNDLRHNVLNKKDQELSPDSFLTFLDKVGTLTTMPNVNEMVLN